MVKHQYNYSHTVWGIYYYICEKCKKKVNDWEKDLDESECSVEITKDAGYTEGFSFAGKTDKEIKRILGNANINDPDITR